MKNALVDDLVVSLLVVLKLSMIFDIINHGILLDKPCDL